jgi:RNA recognition motif-containing protein
MATCATSEIPGFDYLVIMDLEAAGDDPYDVNRQEIVEWPWVVFDLRQRVAVDSKLIYIAPQWGLNPNPSPDLVPGLGIDVAFSPSLKDAVAKFDTYLYHSFALRQKSFCLLTDGQWELPQVLAIEATRKAVPLGSHFRTYFDLRTEFAKCYSTGPQPSDRQTIVNYLAINVSGKTAGRESCLVIADVVARLQNDGHVFANPNVFSEIDWAALSDRIPAVAIPVAAAVPVGGIVRLRGLPWTCSENDVVNFFLGIPIVPNGVHFVRNAHGKATGEAFVQLHTQESVHFALQRHKKMMGRRYIEVFKSSPVDMSNHLGRADARRQLHQQQVMHAQAHKAAAAVAAANDSNTIAPSSSSSARVPLPSHVSSPFSMYPATAISPQGSRGSVGPGTHQGMYQHMSQQLPHQFQEQQFKHQPRNKQDLQENDNMQGYSSEGHHDSSSRGSNNRRIGDLSRSIVLRIVGLPQYMNPDDVVRLFEGLEMVGNGVHFLPSSEGTGSTGDVFVEFTSESWAKKALTRSPITVDNKTILVLRSSHREMSTALTSSPDSVRYLDAGPGRSMIEGSTQKSRPLSMPVYSQYNSAHDLAIRTSAISLGGVSKGSSAGGDELFGTERHHNFENSTPCPSGSARAGAEKDEYFALVVGHWDVGGESLGGLLTGIPGLCRNGVFVDEEAGKGEALAYLAFLSANDRDNAVLSRTNDTGMLNRDASHCVQIVSSKTFSSNTDQQPGCIVRVSGLSSDADDADIFEFFKELDIPRGGIFRTDDGDGLTSGSAWVRFASREHAKNAVDNYNLKMMGRCRIGVQNVHG